MTRRVVALGPGEWRWLAWLLHQQMYWLSCRWRGHSGSMMCWRCGTRLAEFPSVESTERLLEQFPEDQRPGIRMMLQPRTMEVGR